MNDDIWVTHLTHEKLLQGIAGKREFNKPIKPIKLSEEKNTAASRNAKVYRYLQAKGLI